MDLIEQKDKLDVTNVDVQVVKKPSRHGSLLPDTIRAILVGPSGSGKTNHYDICQFRIDRYPGKSYSLSGVKSANHYHAPDP